MSRLRIYNDRYERREHKKAAKLARAQGLLRRGPKISGAWIDCLAVMFESTLDIKLNSMEGQITQRFSEVQKMEINTFRLRQRIMGLA
jgi:hypothetical protein